MWRIDFPVTVYTNVLPYCIHFSARESELYVECHLDWYDGFFLFFFTPYKHRLSTALIRIFCYLDSPFSSWALYQLNGMECVRVSRWLFFPLLSLPLHICLKDFLCVSVCLYVLKCNMSVLQCVFTKRNLCYLVLTQLIMEHWNQNPSRLGQMARSACLTWLHPSALRAKQPRSDEGERMRLIHIHPKIIKSIHFALFQLWHCANLLKYSNERFKEKVP